jgi:colanic acid biosynthesis glycosyl transferase WcaI
MKIAVWGINYAPELTGIAPFNRALCEFLAAQGHQVGAITGFPYYPVWRKRDEDRGQWFRTEVLNGVVIRRCWLYVPVVVGPLRRMLHEASFVVVSLLRVLALPKPDLFVVISPPLPLGIAAWIASVVKGVPYVFHVQDLQPDAAVGLGMVRPGVLTRILYWMESFAYARAARVSGISRGMLGKFREKGVPEEKLVYFPNGVELPIDLPPPGRFRARHGLSPDAFVAMYSGNLGVKQGLDVLIEAARFLQSWEEMAFSTRERSPFAGDRVVRIVVAGDGARRVHLAELIREYALDNVLLLPLQLEDSYREMLADTDCSVITQQEGTGSFFFPSKLLTSLAVGKPVITVADTNSELAHATMEGKFGVNVPPNQPEALARAIRSLADDSGIPGEMRRASRA